MGDREAGSLRLSGEKRASLGLDLHDPPLMSAFHNGEARQGDASPLFSGQVIIDKLDPRVTRKLRVVRGAVYYGHGRSFLSERERN